MILVDRALAAREAEGNPITVGLIGAGFMGRAIALQMVRSTPGMRLVAIGTRTVEKAGQAFHDAGIDDPQPVESVAELEKCISRGGHAVTDDPLLLCEADGIDAVFEVTGAVEFGSRVALTAFEHGKHLIVMNAELDGTVGPVLKARADKAGVVFTNSEGDQPGVILNLYRFVEGIGVRPALAGNIKGLHDPYRNPTTQEDFARKWGQNPQMVTAFADGSKISFEQAIVGNATGMKVARRGMIGPTVPTGTPIEDVKELFEGEPLLDGPGMVDYVVGAAPNPGVFVLGTHDDPIHKHYLNLYKLGEGPLYCFYTPYHLCHFEAPTTVARAVLFGDAAIAPLGGPVVEVIAAAKTDLAEGDVLDGIGCYKTYGLCENAEVVSQEALLPIGIAEGCRVTRSVAKDEVLRYSDVELPAGRLVDELRTEQAELFGLQAAATQAMGALAGE